MPGVYLLRCVIAIVHLREKERASDAASLAYFSEGTVVASALHLCATCTDALTTKLIMTFIVRGLLPHVGHCLAAKGITARHALF